jgi:hypothetical protein
LPFRDGDTALVPGSYAISETAAAGFDTSVQCDNGDGNPDGNMTMTLGPGSTAPVSLDSPPLICYPVMTG